MSITPQAIRDLLDELEASKQARLRAWAGGRPSPGDTPKPSGAFGKWAARLGPVGVLLWKFKTIALLVLTKGKLLLLGLTKIKTLASMLVAIWFSGTITFACGSRRHRMPAR